MSLTMENVYLRKMLNSIKKSHKITILHKAVIRSTGFYFRYNKCGVPLFEKYLSGLPTVEWNVVVFSKRYTHSNNKLSIKVENKRGRGSRTAGMCGVRDAGGVGGGCANLSHPAELRQEIVTHYNNQRTNCNHSNRKEHLVNAKKIFSFFFTLNNNIFFYRKLSLRSVIIHYVISSTSAFFYKIYLSTVTFAKEAMAVCTCSSMHVK